MTPCRVEMVEDRSSFPCFYLRRSVVLLSSFWAVHKEVFENVIVLAARKRITALAADDLSVPQLRSCFSANKIVLRTASRTLKGHGL